MTGAERWAKARKVLEAGLLAWAALAAWRVATNGFQFAVEWVGSGPDLGPIIPYLGAWPIWSNWGGTDFFSAVYALPPAFVVTAIAAALAEPAKWRAARRNDFHLYLLCAAFQIVVVWAAFSRSAPDWAAHFESLLLTRGTLEALTEYHWFYGPQVPLRPLLPLAAIVGLLFARSHRGQAFLAAVSSAAKRAWRMRLRLVLPVLLVVVALVAVLLPWIAEPLRESRPPNWVRLAFSAFSLVTLALLWKKGEKFLWRLPLPGMLGAAWLLGALAPWLTRLWLPPEKAWPYLGNVAAFPWSEKAEPLSTTPVLCGALVFACLAAALLEPAKIARAKTGYGRLLALQAILFVDIVACAAPDWSAYFLAELLPGLAGAPAAALPSWPWISLLALTVVVRTGSSPFHRKIPEST